MRLIRQGQAVERAEGPLVALPERGDRQGMGVKSPSRAVFSAPFEIGTQHAMLIASKRDML